MNATQQHDPAALADASERCVLHAMAAAPRFPILERGAGARIWDVAGNEYLDAVSGTNGPAMVGHSRPEVAEAVYNQMKSLPSHSFRHDSVPVVQFAERMAGIAPMPMAKTFLCPGGGEAVEAAVKLAMRVTGKTEAISLYGAYHGMSLATMSLGGMPALREWFPGAVRWPTFRQVPAPHPYRSPFGHDGDWRTAVHALESNLDNAGYGRVAAVVMELVQGPGGHVDFGPDYCQAVQRVCNERGIIFIVDEVQTGLARCGRMWACDYYGVQPDFVTVGKAFGGGFPFGAVIARGDLLPEGIDEEPWNILTFMNQPLQAAAALAVVDIVEKENLADRAASLGAEATRRFRDMAERYEVIGDVRGPGMFIGLDLVNDRDTREPATEACKRAWPYAVSIGLLTWFGGAVNVLKFKPPLSLSEAEFDAILSRIEQVVAFVESEVHGGGPTVAGAKTPEVSHTTA